MPAYFISEIKVTNRELYSRYVEAVPEIVHKHGGRYLVRGGTITPILTDWNPEKIVLIEFDSVQQIRECLESPEYRRIAPFREQSTISRAVIVEGCR